MFLYDFHCSDCGAVFESLEDKGTDEVRCQLCPSPARRIISGTHAGTVYGAAVTRGKREAPPDPRMMDTRAMGEGMGRGEWRRQRKSMWRDEMRKEHGTYGRRKVYY